MVSMIQSQGAQALISTVPQYHHTPDVYYPNPTYNDPRRLAMLNDMYKSFASTHSVAVFDLARFVQPSDFIDDGVHFSPEGSTRLSAFLDPALKALADSSPPRVPPAGLLLAAAPPAPIGSGTR
jgi:lysophospholipase L1-like esterase